MNKINFIQIQNNGPEIKSTNYWDLEHAKKGYFFLSINAGVFRLLIPDSQFEQIIEMMKAECVIISRGPWPEQEKADALEIMFEDKSDSPYAIWIVPEQCDRLPLDSDVGKQKIFSAWTRSGKAFEIPCYYRRVKQLPWMKEL